MDNMRYAAVTAFPSSWRQPAVSILSHECVCKFLFVCNESPLRGKFVGKIRSVIVESTQGILGTPLSYRFKKVSVIQSHDKPPQKLSWNPQKCISHRDCSKESLKCDQNNERVHQLCYPFVGRQIDQLKLQ